ncbi:MAG: cytochrome c-type biogenesis protein CcmH [Cystobacterineae bacterium]|nr:cytochrome c-type biogenesis protein CcmH [Cystobacterineae bacterium]
MNAPTLCACLAGAWLATAQAQTPEVESPWHAPTREGMAPLAPALEARVQKLGKEIRCPMCQGLSVADSTSSSARAQMDKIRELVSQNKSDEEIREFFVSRYGEWALLEPTKRGFNLILYMSPFALLALGLALVFLRRSKNNTAVENMGTPLALNVEATSPPAEHKAAENTTAENSHAARVLLDMDAPPLPPPQGGEAMALYARYENVLGQFREQREERHLLSTAEADKEEARLLEEAVCCLKKLDEASAAFGTQQAPAPQNPSASSRQRLWLAAVGGLLVGCFAVLASMQLFEQAKLSPPASPQEDMPHVPAHREDVALKAAFEYFRMNPADLDGAAYLTKLHIQRRQWDAATTLVLAGSSADPLHVPFRIYRCVLEGMQPNLRRERADELAKLFATYDGAYEAAFWAAAFYRVLGDNPQALAMLQAFKESAPLEELPPELDEWIAEIQALPPTHATP